MIEGKNIVVAGFGRTGEAVTEFLRHFPCRITVSESKRASELESARIHYPEVAFEFGGHTPSTFLNADLIVLSPGIPDSIPVLVQARQKGIPILSEIELAYRYLKGTLIGITGTNGKSTTTELTAAMLNQGGKTAFACGNLGTPLVHYCLSSKPNHYYVAELSSFQLETIQKFRPHIAAILNLTEDHLDRYPNLDAYFRAKMRIFENQDQSDFAVLNYDDSYLRKNAESIKANRFWFSRSNVPPAGLYAKDGLIRVISGGSIVNFNQATIKGVHHLENTLCASSIALLCGVRNKAMQTAVEQFLPLPHRMELVGEIDGVGYYDDSKATNVDSVVKSLQSFPGNIILIMGGRDKGGDYSPLRDLIKEKVKALFLIGEAKREFRAISEKQKRP